MFKKTDPSLPGEYQLQSSGTYILVTCLGVDAPRRSYSEDMRKMVNRAQVEETGHEHGIIADVDLS